MQAFKFNKFSDETIEALQHYVYRLIDPRNGETFYVGRGQGNRVFDHLNCALQDNDGDQMNPKYEKIHAIHNAGLTVIHIIHRHGMDLDTCKIVEAALIDAYPGLSNIQSGYGSSDYGPANAWELEQHYRSEVADIGSQTHKLLMINVNTSLEDQDLYRAVRFAWRLDIKRARQADYVLAVYRGKIVGIFQAAEWKAANKSNFPEIDLDRPNRFGFDGVQLELESHGKEICELYLGKRLPEHYRKKGSANPIKYNWK